MSAGALAALHFSLFAGVGAVAVGFGVFTLARAMFAFHGFTSA
jgi:hypothetical protein